MRRIGVFLVISAVCFSLSGCTSQNGEDAGSEVLSSIEGPWICSDVFEKEEAFFLAEVSSDSFVVSEISFELSDGVWKGDLKEGRDHNWLSQKDEEKISISYDEEKEEIAVDDLMQYESLTFHKASCLEKVDLKLEKIIGAKKTGVGETAQAEDYVLVIEAKEEIEKEILQSVVEELVPNIEARQYVVREKDEPKGVVIGNKKVYIDVDLPGAKTKSGIYDVGKKKATYEIKAGELEKVESTPTKISESSKSGDKEKPIQVSPKPQKPNQSKPQAEQTKPQAQAPTKPAAPAKQPATPQHVHNWQPVYTTVHHDAQYQTVHHDAVTQDQWIVDQPSYGKVVCLGCGQEFDSVDAWVNHGDSYPEENFFEHSSYTVKSYPEKGHNETVVVTPAWDEQVQTSSPWDEQVVSGYQCSCGARK